MDGTNPHGDAPTFDAGTYGRSFADVYDEWYGERDPGPVVALLRRLAPPPAPVLELGVGTGRVALALVDAGYEVWGVDTSPEMLAVADTKAGERSSRANLHLVEGDAAVAGDLPAGPFAVVLGAFNLLCNLADRPAQAACLAAGASVLADDGIVVLETFVAAAPAERRRDLVTRSVEADRVVLIATDTDPATSTITGSHIELRDGEAPRLRPWRVCFLTPGELDELASAAGLELADRWGDADGTPFVAGESPQHVSVYRRRPHHD